MWETLHFINNDLYSDLNLSTDIKGLEPHNTLS